MSEEEVNEELVFVNYLLKSSVDVSSNLVKRQRTLTECCIFLFIFFLIYFLLMKLLVYAGWARWEDVFVDDWGQFNGVDFVDF